LLSISQTCLPRTNFEAETIFSGNELYEFLKSGLIENKVLEAH